MGGIPRRPPTARDSASSVPASPITPAGGRRTGPSPPVRQHAVPHAVRSCGRGWPGLFSQRSREPGLRAARRAAVRPNAVPSKPVGTFMPLTSAQSTFMAGRFRSHTERVVLFRSFVHPSGATARLELPSGCASRAIDTSRRTRGCVPGKLVRSVFPTVSPRRHPGPTAHSHTGAERAVRHEKCTRAHTRRSVACGAHASTGMRRGPYDTPVRQRIRRRTNQGITMTGRCARLARRPATEPKIRPTKPCVEPTTIASASYSSPTSSNS
jgi:hypothetical protein